MTSHTQDEMMIKLEDWFDPYDVSHMEAYEKLCKTGSWPEKFIPKHVYTGYLAVININAKIAQAWMSYMLYNQLNDGNPF
jgi:hypothetical protein